MPEQTPKHKGREFLTFLVNDSRRLRL